MNTGVVALGAALGLVVCAAAVGASPAPLLADPAAALGEPAPPWRVAGLPRQEQALTRYRVVERDGLRALEIDAQASYGNLVHELPERGVGRQLSWWWRIELDNPATDLRTKAGDDHAVAVCALFDLPIAAVPFVERQLLRLARLFSGQPLPAATLCYTWDARLPRDTVLDSPYTRRVRLIVLHGAGEPLQAWQHEQRDLRADFLRLFGAEATVLPPLTAVVVAGDADNTAGHSIALVRELQLQ